MPRAGNRTVFLKRPRGRPNDGYAWLSTRPLHVLLFLTPLMLAYEVGSIVYLSGHGYMITNSADRILRGFFELFGVASLHLPPLALTVALLAWHIFERDPWKVRPMTLLGMAAESALWMLPILVFGRVLGLVAAETEPASALVAPTWQSALTLSIGAGIYEELLFRLILITAVHFILVDLIKLKDGPAFLAAAVVSSAAFVIYHDLGPAGGVELRRVLFFAGAGLYFAGLFIMRGFGVVVGTHALYDVVALLLMGGDRAGG